MFLLLKWRRDVFAYCLQTFLAFLFSSRHRLRFGRRKIKDDKKGLCRRQPKPAWVIQEVIRLKALMTDAGCRKIADVFNRRFSHSREMTVSKSFVNGVIRKYNYDIQILRREIKNRRPKAVPKNLAWGLDLTGKTDTNNNLNYILGIVEHKSSPCLDLAVLKNRA